MSLPGLDGLSLCRAVRAEGPNRNIPILLLSSRDTESDRVLGFESGADDYLPKPFGVRELLARVSALLQEEPASRESVEPSRRVVASEVVVDGDRREVIVRGRPVKLTRQEFELVYLLASKRGIVFSRAALLANVWKGNAAVTDRTIDTMVSRVRRKNRAHASPPSTAPDRLGRRLQVRRRGLSAVTRGRDGARRPVAGRRRLTS